MLNMALVAELAAVLGKYPTLRCTPSVEITDDGLVLTVDFAREAQETVRDEDALHDYLRFDLQRVQDLATMRSLCAHYGLDAQWLETALNGNKGEPHARD